MIVDLVIGIIGYLGVFVVGRKVVFVWVVNLRLRFCRMENAAVFLVIVIIVWADAFFAGWIVN